jgi:hypothetical protein
MQDFFSFSTNTWMCVGRVMQEQLPRRINRRIASYATIYATPKMRKKTSKMLIYLWLGTYIPPSREKELREKNFGTINIRKRSIKQVLNTLFHRIVKKFMIQGGGAGGNLTHVEQENDAFALSVLK